MHNTNFERKLSAAQTEVWGTIYPSFSDDNGLNFRATANYEEQEAFDHDWHGGSNWPVMGWTIEDWVVNTQLDLSQDQINEIDKLIGEYFCEEEIDTLVEY